MYFYLSFLLEHHISNECFSYLFLSLYYGMSDFMKNNIIVVFFFSNSGFKKRFRKFPFISKANKQDVGQV